MPDERIASLIQQIDADRLRAHIHYLAADPLPYRKLDYTLPGHERSTLDEADAYIQGQLESFGYAVEREAVQVQAFRCDANKPKAHQYSKPEPEDPWYTAHNLYARHAGTDRAGEAIVICSHKDSPSWADSPGAYDNAVGTAANLEMARGLATEELPVSLWHLFCNEEHTPWTSVTGYTTPEGKRLADLMAVVNADYGIGLIQRSFKRESPGDDDGSFVNAGYPAAVINVGSLPYGDPHYHAEGDTAAHVDVENVRMSTQAVLAAALTLALG